MNSSKLARQARALILATGGAMLIGNFASANTFTWTRGGTNNNWDAAANWMPGAPPVTPAPGTTTDILYSGTQLVASTSSAMRQDYTVDSVTFAADFNQTASFSLTTQSALLAGATSANLTVLAGGITNQVGTGTIPGFNVAITKNAAVTGDLVVGADQTWNINQPVPPAGGSAITFTISRPIRNTGNFTVTKSGQGLLVLAQDNPSWGGTLNFTNGSIRTGGTTSGQFGTAAIRYSGGNDVTITSSSVNTVGADKLFQNDVFLNGTGAFILGGSFAANFGVNSTMTLEQDSRLGAATRTEINGDITGNFALTKVNGGILQFNTANTYTGATTVSQGVLLVANSGGLGSSAAGVTVADGAALELQNNVAIAGKPLDITGVGLATGNATFGTQATSGALRNRSGMNSFAGAVNVSGADTFVGVDAGELQLSGGVTSSGTASLRAGGAGTLTVKNLNVNGLALDAGAHVKVSPNGTIAGTSSVGTAAFAGGNAAPTAQLDLTNNAIVFQGGGVTVSDVGSLVKSGFAGGSWNGNGIVSSTAAGSSSFGVGYAAAQGISVAPIFGTVASDAVLARYTRRGDANLSGDVNIQDFARLASGFGQPGEWSNGDFNYDGTVNINDFALLAANFGQGIPADLPRGSAVPEPATLGLLALALPILSRRRR